MDYSRTSDQILNYIFQIPKTLTLDELLEFERKREEQREKVEQALESLNTKGCVKTHRNDEAEIVYTCTDDSIEFKRLSEFQKTVWYSLKNPSHFKAIILQCQFDKSNQTAIFIANKCAENLKPNPKVLPVLILFLDNDKGILDQTVVSLNKTLCVQYDITDGDYPGLIKLYSSDPKATVDSVTGAIARYNQSYLYDLPKKEYPLVIVALTNQVQITKVEQIYKQAIHDIVKLQPACKLRATFVFDEVDKTYPLAIPKMKTYFIEDKIGISNVLGVTATEDGLTDKYPEWASAELLNVNVDEEKEKNHRGIHHTDSVIHQVDQKTKETNVEYALKIINDNMDHFKKPRINPKNGNSYYSKTLLLADQRVSSHTHVANDLHKKGFHQILQNGNNLKVRRHDQITFAQVRTSGKVLRNVLKQIFDELDMWDAPVALIGFKKIDRGLGYHYAPPEGGKGLIWTDEIMGYISGEASGIQRVSRMHGVIAQCEDYPNEQHYWVDKRTDRTVRNNANVVISLNKDYHGSIPLKMRLKYAHDVTHKIKKFGSKQCIGETLSFDTYEGAIEFIMTVIKPLKPTAKPEKEGYYLKDGKYVTTLVNSDGAGRRPYTVEEYEQVDKTISTQSFLNSDLEKFGISYTMMPLYKDDEHTHLVWYIRYAITKFECVGITREEVLQSKVPYEIDIEIEGDSVKFIVSKKETIENTDDFISHA
jgi:hypothetical protein